MLVFDVASEPALLEAARIKAAEATAAAGVRDRAHPTEAGDRISLEGMAAEACAMKMLQEESIGLWVADLGRNYGEDIKIVMVHGLDKPIEIKETRYFGERIGILFMRCESGDGKPGGTLDFEYWEEHLPDSYYILFHQMRRATQPYKFRAIGWATRQMFLDGFDDNQCKLDKLNTNEPGYPAICLGHWELRSMDVFPVPFGLRDGVSNPSAGGIR